MKRRSSAKSMLSISPSTAGSYCAPENTWETMMLWPADGMEWIV